MQRLNLNNGVTDAVAKDLWSNIFSVSNSGKYAAYSVYLNDSVQTVVKNLESGSKKYMRQIPYDSQVSFSPDETKIIFTPLTGKDQKFELITIDLSNFKTIHTLNDLNLLAVLSNFQALAENSDGALEIINLDGGNSIKLNTDNEYFEGILTAK